MFFQPWAHLPQLEEVSNINLYELFGLTKESSVEEIQESYNNLAENTDRINMIYETFSNLMPHEKVDIVDRIMLLNFLHNILIDEELKSSYDKGDNSAILPNIANSLSTFPGSTTVKLNITTNLTEIYSGITKTEKYIRKGLCEECNGTGDTSKQLKICQLCTGTGMVFPDSNMAMMNPGIIQFASPHACTACNSTGKDLSYDPCTFCEGFGVSKCEETIEVPLLKMLQNLEERIIPGQGHHLYGHEVGVLKINLTIKKDPVFNVGVRKPGNLMTKQNISLKEFLCGCSFEIKHINGKKLLIKIDKGDLKQFKCFKTIKGEGLPIFGSDGFGDLVICFEIKCPEFNSDLTVDSQIKDINGECRNVLKSDDNVETVLEEFTEVTPLQTNPPIHPFNNFNFSEPAYYNPNQNIP